MLEFKQYVERRDRVEAIQFLTIGQAEDVAQFIHAKDWNVRVVNGGWEFWVELTLSEDPHIVQRVNRGDFVTKQGDVISRFEFGQQWELDE